MLLHYLISFCSRPPLFPLFPRTLFPVSIPLPVCFFFPPFPPVSCHFFPLPFIRPISLLPSRLFPFYISLPFLYFQFLSWFACLVFFHFPFYSPSFRFSFLYSLFSPSISWGGVVRWYRYGMLPVLQRLDQTWRRIEILILAYIFFDD